MMLLMAENPEKKAGDAGGAAEADGGAERRRYRRLQVPVFCRPAGMQFMTRRHPVDLSFGGVRIFSDQPFKMGELLTLEFFAADAPASTFTAEVVWIDELRLIPRRASTWACGSRTWTRCRSRRSRRCWVRSAKARREPL